jgi:hypothetical protein
MIYEKRNMTTRTHFPDDHPRPAGAAFVKPQPGTLQSDAQLAQWVRDTVKKMDAPLDPTNSTDQGQVFQAACFLVASSLIGADEHRIAEALGYTPQLVADWARNLRQNGLWLSDGRVVDTPWFEKTSGATCFAIDTLVAEGFIERHTHPVKGAVYQINPGRHLLEIN